MPSRERHEAAVEAADEDQPLSPAVQKQPSANRKAAQSTAEAVA